MAVNNYTISICILCWCPYTQKKMCSLVGTNIYACSSIWLGPYLAAERQMVLGSIPYQFPSFWEVFHIAIEIIGVLLYAKLYAIARKVLW
jgi:hypothetical protein